MNRQVPYDFITKKLGGSSKQDNHALWEKMKVVLDKEMPEKKKKRRFIFWFFSANVLIIAGCFTGLAALGIYFYNTKTASTVSTSTGGNKINTVEGARENELAADENAHKLININASPVASTTSDKANNNNSIRANKKSTLKGNTSQPTIGNDNSNRLTAAGKQNIRKLTTGITNQRDLHADKAKGGRIVKQGNITGADNKQNATDIAPDNGISPVQNRTRHIDPAKLKKPGYEPLQPKARKEIIGTVVPTAAFIKNHQFKGFTAGAGMSMNIPMAGQSMTAISASGNNNPLLDYLPSVYGQYHFNNKLYIESGLRLFSPQNTEEHTLYEGYYDATSDQYKEKEITLKKLYYLDIPVSVHYSPLPKLNIGTGIQYSWLMRSVLKEETCLWQKGLDGWGKAWQGEDIVVRSNPEVEEKKYGYYGTASNPLQPIDTVARSFRPHEFRLLLDANYTVKRYSFGLRYNLALSNYINANTGYNHTNITDRNKSLQFYFHYSLLDRRKKK
jgi:hypothetical protein